MAHKVRKLVHHDVFNALERLIAQIQIEIERSFLEVAASPARLHRVDADGGGGCDKAALLVSQLEFQHTRKDEVLVTLSDDVKELRFSCRLILGMNIGGRASPVLIARDDLGDTIGVAHKERVDLHLRRGTRNGQADRSVGANAKVESLDTADVEFVRVLRSRIGKGLTYTFLLAIHFLASTLRSRQSNSYRAVLFESQ